MISVMLVDDHEMMLDGLRAALESQEEIDVVATATTVESGIDRFRSLRPDVVVADYRIGERTGADLTRAILEIDSSAIVVALSALVTSHTLHELIDAGCAAFVPKGQGVAELVAAIRAAADGAVMFPRHLISTGPDRGLQIRSELTQRELEVLSLLGQGSNATAIAVQLHLSSHTVRNHIREILRKLGVSSQLAAVVKAAQDGIIPSPGPTV